MPVEVDPLLFTQVLANLLVNAAEAMAPKGGRVELDRAPDRILGHDEIAIRVADQGPGISGTRTSASCSSPSSRPSTGGTASASRSARTSCSSTAAGLSAGNRPPA